ncbi:hypothetical protein NRB_36920 [Novosphingobium sp. 11B]
MLHVARDHPDQIVHVPGHRMAGDHVGIVGDRLLEPGDVLIHMGDEVDEYVGLQLEAQPPRVEHRYIAPDHAFILQPLDAAADRRCGKRHPLRHLRHRHARIFLQRRDDPAIEFVQLHRSPL